MTVAALFVDARVGKRQASATPLEFRDVLLGMARSVARAEAQP